MLEPITSPQPMAGRRGLLRSAVPITIPTSDTDGVEGEPGRRPTWENGVGFDPETCEVVGPIDLNCWADDGILKGVPANPAVVGFRPIGALGGDRCTAVDRRRDRKGKAERNLLATESFQVEQEVFDGVVSSTRDDADHRNPFLTNSTADTATDGATAPVYALASVERDLAACLHGQRGMIHATPDVVTLWDSFGLLRVEGEQLLTVHDTIVVGGSGYSGNAPTGVAAAAGSSWVYGSPLMYQLVSGIIDVSGGDQASRIDRTVNDETYLVERIVAVLWNPCCLIAGQVDVSPPA